MRAMRAPSSLWIVFLLGTSRLKAWCTWKSGGHSSGRRCRRAALAAASLASYNGLGGGRRQAGRQATVCRRRDYMSEADGCMSGGRQLGSASHRGGIGDSRQLESAGTKAAVCRTSVARDVLTSAAECLSPRRNWRLQAARECVSPAEGTGDSRQLGSAGIKQLSLGPVQGRDDALTSAGRSAAVCRTSVGKEWCVGQHRDCGCLSTSKREAGGGSPTKDWGRRCGALCGEADGRSRLLERRQRCLTREEVRLSVQREGSD